jgi:type IV secretion system protein VirB5
MLSKSKKAPSAASFADSVSSTGKGQQPPPVDPYTEVRREFTDKYQGLINQRKAWMAATFFVLAICGLETIYLGQLAKQNKLVPYVVEIDRAGLPSNISAVSASPAVDERIVRAMLARFIQDSRGVTADGQVQVQMINRVYSMLAQGSRAVTLMSDFYRTDPPPRRAATQTVTADVSNLLPISADTWQVEWKEITRNTGGELVSELRWKASLSVVVSPGVDEKLLLINPMGVFIRDVSWSQVI